MGFKMRKFVVGDVEYECPDIGVVEGSVDPIFEILEGDQKGVKFTFTNMHMDEKDGSLMWYDLSTQSKDVDKIKPIVDNFILQIMYDQIERIENEGGSSE